MPMISTNNKPRLSSRILFLSLTAPPGHHIYSSNLVSLEQHDPDSPLLAFSVFCGETGELLSMPPFPSGIKSMTLSSFILSASSCVTPCYLKNWGNFLTSPPHPILASVSLQLSSYQKSVLVCFHLFVNCFIPLPVLG